MVDEYNHAFEQHRIACGQCWNGLNYCPEGRELLNVNVIPEVKPYDPGEPFIHPMAFVHPTARLGRGTKVWQFASVMHGAVLGENCAVGPAGFVGVNATLGNHVRMQHAAHITDHAIVGNFVFVGNGVMTTNDKNPIVNNVHYKREVPIIEDSVSIGAGAVILPGVRLGRGCVIGAGAVVTHYVEPYATVIGNPARMIHR